MTRDSEATVSNLHAAFGSWVIEHTSQVAMDLYPAITCRCLGKCGLGLQPSSRRIASLGVWCRSSKDSSCLNSQREVKRYFQFSLRDAISCYFFSCSCMLVRVDFLALVSHPGRQLLWKCKESVRMLMCRGHCSSSQAVSEKLPFFFLPVRELSFTYYIPNLILFLFYIFIYSSLIFCILTSVSPPSSRPSPSHLSSFPDLLFLHFSSEKSRSPKDVKQT